MDKTKLKALLIPPDTTIKQTMQRLNETAEKILFVVDGDERLLGTVTDGDIRRGIIKGVPLSVAIKEIMKAGSISLTQGSNDLLKRAKKIMQQKQIGEIPVVNQDGVITDIIFWVDLLDPKRQKQKSSLFDNPVVIMAGGKGTRLSPFTKILPKPLIPIGEKPIIEHIMDHFYKNGFHRFILILNYKKEMIKVYFKENSLPYEIEFMEESDYRGTAGGLSLARKRLDDTFIVTNCDTILTGDDYADFLRWHEHRKNLLTIVGTHREVMIPYGVLNMKDDFLVNMDEKPKFDLFINTGAYILNPSVLNFISDGDYIDMDQLIGKVRLSHSDKVGVYPHWGGWLDMGQLEEYRKSLKELGVGDGYGD